MSAPATLIFVYNADSGVINGLIDLVHKTVSPQTYPCSLCAVTYGPLGMRRRWRDFVAQLGMRVRFLHRDELAAEFGRTQEELPALFVERSGALDTVIAAPQMRTVVSLEDLMALVAARTDLLHAQPHGHAVS